MMRHVAANALTFIILGLVILFGIVTWAQSEYRAPGPLTEPLLLEVARGATLTDVTRDLDERNAISDPRIFRIAARYTDMDAGLRFGEYSIPAGASMEEILELLNEGANVLRQIVVPEGWTSWQVVEALNAREELTGEIAAVPAEGTLAPAGYDFQKGDDRNAILARMQARQQEILVTAWTGRDKALPLNSPEELLTLASIVEKETGVPEERPQVAAVFVNRLNRGMRLQTDPTVIYGHHRGQGAAGARAEGERTGHRHALQHLCHRGPAAGADRQSRPRGHRGGGQSARVGGFLFRGGRLGRPCLRRDAGAAQRQRGGLAAARGAAGAGGGSRGGGRGGRRRRASRPRGRRWGSRRPTVGHWVTT